MKAVQVGMVVSATFSKEQFESLMKLVRTGDVEQLDPIETMHISNIKQDISRSNKTYIEVI